MLRDFGINLDPLNGHIGQVNLGDGYMNINSSCSNMSRAKIKINENVYETDKNIIIEGNCNRVTIDGMGDVTIEGNCGTVEINGMANVNIHGNVATKIQN